MTSKPRQTAPSGPRRAPWERLDTESDPAWAAFREYRNAGLTRSTAGVAQTLGKSTTLIHRWSAKHSWVLRANAWDREEDRLWQIDLRARRRRATDRNLTTAGAAMQLAGQGLQALVGKANELKPGDVARLMEVAARIEALALGSATEIVQTTGPAGQAASRSHVGHLSDEDRRARMLQLQRELEGRLAEQGDPDLDRQEQSA